MNDSLTPAPLTCPLCEDGKMHLTELESSDMANQNKSYMWICDTCPGILLEWYGDADTDAFVRYTKEESRAEDGKTDS